MHNFVTAAHNVCKCITCQYVNNFDLCNQQVNARVLGKGLELLSVNGGRFEINQLLFADDTA